MKRYFALIVLTIVACFLRDVQAQHTLQLDPGNGNYITISAPVGLNPGYNWILPPNPPPPNTAFTEGGSLEGQTLRWNSTVGYYVPTSALLIQASGAMTLNPGEGNNVTLTNIPPDNSAALFLTVNNNNELRLRTLGSILGVNANEGLVYDEPNIKLGAGDAITNPFLSDRYVNISTQLLAFTSGGQSTDLLVLDGTTGTVGIGLSPTNTFELEVAGDVGPGTTNVYTLGSPDVRWKDLYLGPSSLYIGVAALDQAKLGYDNADEAAQMLTIDADDDATIDASIDESGRLAVKDGLESIGNTDLTFRTNGDIRARFISGNDEETEGAFVPGQNSVYDLGTPELRWREIYVSEGSLRIGKFINGANGSQNPQASIDEVTLSYENGALVIDKPVANVGSMIPTSNNILALGADSNRWADLWLGPNSLHIGSPAYEGSISYDPTAMQLKFNSNNTIGSSELIIDNSGNVIIAALSAGGLLKANVGGQLALATGGTDFESPLTFSNGLTRTVNNVTLGGTLTGATDINLGGYDFTFTRTTGKVSIGAGPTPTELLSVGTASAFQVNNAGQIVAATGITSSGTVTFSGLPTGIVHSTAGVLSSSPLNLAGGATEVSGILGVANGGTGLSTVGSNGDILTVVTGAPAWQSLSALQITSGTGTPGQLAYWSGANTLGDAPITYDDGSLLVTSSVFEVTSGTVEVTSSSVVVSGSTLVVSSDDLTVTSTGPIHVTSGVFDLTTSDSIIVETTAPLVVSSGSVKVNSSDSLIFESGPLLVSSGSVRVNSSDSLIFESGPLLVSSGRVDVSSSDSITFLTSGPYIVSASTFVVGSLNTPGVLHTDVSGVFSVSPVNLNGEVTGFLTPSMGGTGLTTFSPYSLLLSGPSNIWTELVNGTTGQILAVSNTGPAWTNPEDLNIVTGSGSDGDILFWSGSPAVSSDNGLNFSGSTLSISGDINVGASGSGGTNVRVNLADGHLRSQQSTAPTETEGASIGTGGTSSLANGTDVAGMITILTGTGPAAGLQTTITFAATYNVAPIVTITPMNAASAAIQAYVTSTATTFTVSFGAVPAASTTYEFFYHVIETQDGLLIN